MERPLWMVLVCSAAVHLISATPAHAWWEYIEALSGPKLHGPHIEARLFCFMEKMSGPDVDVLKKYTPRQGDLKVLALPGISVPCLKKINLGQIEEGAEVRKRYSFDASARWHWDNSFEPAEPHRVNFFSSEFVMTFYVFKRPTRDVLDVSAGVGWYKFRSDAFDSFKGLLYDLRADVHVPTVIRRLSKWTVFIPSGRVGVLTFPAGFKTNAFAAPGQSSKRMDGPEKAFYVGYFFDLEPFLSERITAGVFQ